MLHYSTGAILKYEDHSNGLNQLKQKQIYEIFKYNRNVQLNIEGMG